MDEHEDNIQKRLFEKGDLLNGLDDLRTHIGRQTFPGVAWYAHPRRRVHIFLWPALAAAAAAAIVLVALIFSHAGPASTPQQPLAQAPPTTAPSMDTIESDLLVIEYLAQDKREDWINYVPADNSDDEWPMMQSDQSPSIPRSSM